MRTMQPQSAHVTLSMRVVCFFRPLLASRVACGYGPIDSAARCKRSVSAGPAVVARIGRVIAGMTHAAIGAAEQANPAAIIEQSIREIDGAADDVRAELGKVMAEKHRLGARSATSRRSRRWSTR